MQELYWHTAEKPNPSALPNLRKITRYMTEHGHTSTSNPISGSRLSMETGIAFTQLRNLINRPGFVYLKTGRQSSSGWYWDTKYGLDYPESFPASTQPLRMIDTSTPTSPEITQSHNIGQSKVTAQLLKPGQIIIEPGPIADGTVTIANVQMQIVNVFAKVASGERTATQAAEWMYRIAQGIHSGTLTISGGTE